MMDHGVWYLKQGEWQAAEVVLRRSTLLFKDVAGDQNIESAMMMNNWAITLLHQDRWQEAETLLVKTSILSSRVLGDHHPITLSCLNNLAMSCIYRYQSARGETILRSVSTAGAREFGAQHPITTISSNNLTNVHTKYQGRPLPLVAVVTAMGETPTLPSLLEWGKRIAILLKFLIMLVIWVYGLSDVIAETWKCSKSFFQLGVSFSRFVYRLLVFGFTFSYFIASTIEILRLFFS